MSAITYGVKWGVMAFFACATILVIIMAITGNLQDKAAHIPGWIAVVIASCVAGVFAHGHKQDHPKKAGE